jgi:hypothetical protein
MTISGFREARSMLPYLGLQMGDTICLYMHDAICLYLHSAGRL